MIFKSKTAKPFHLKGRRPTNQNSVLFHERVQTDSRRFTFHWFVMIREILWINDQSFANQKFQLSWKFIQQFNFSQ